MKGTDDRTSAENDASKSRSHRGAGGEIVADVGGTSAVEATALRFSTFETVSPLPRSSRVAAPGKGGNYVCPGFWLVAAVPVLPPSVGKESEWNCFVFFCRYSNAGAAVKALTQGAVDEQSDDKGSKLKRKHGTKWVSRRVSGSVCACLKVRRCEST